jgi:hypothetical protein
LGDFFTLKEGPEFMCPIPIKRWVGALCEPGAKSDLRPHPPSAVL